MRDWLGRLLSIAAIAAAGALLTAWVAGAAFAAIFLFAYLVAVVAVGLAGRSRLARWLARPLPEDMPEGEGPWTDIYARLYPLLRRQKASHASLSHALWRFRQAAEAMPDGVVVLDDANHIGWMNPTAEAHFGLTLRRDRGNAITNLVRHPSFGDYLAAWAVGEPLVLDGAREDGRILSLQLVPFGDRERLLLSRDVTRWERLEAIRRDFIANVSHELRTPLTVVRGFLETLADADAHDEAAYRRSLALMAEQAERMQRLVEDLLTLSRLEDARNPLREEVVDVPALVRSVVADAEAMDRGAHRITATVAGHGLAGNRDELRSAFSNLVTNALRYTPAGGEVHVDWALERGQPVLRVRDTGEGIAPEHVPRLTERFYRVDRSRSRATGGTGLGLAIVKHVLQRHQARLDIASVVGEGSTFTCTFPDVRLARPGR